MAELAVKAAKHLLSKSDNYDDFQKRLLSWRNVPSANEKLSPAEKFYGRRQRDGLPTVPLVPLLVPPKEDSSHLPHFPLGTRIRIQNPISNKWDTLGKVVGIRNSGLSYEILKDDGSTAIRGRRLVKSTNAPLDLFPDPEFPDFDDDEIPIAPSQSEVGPQRTPGTSSDHGTPAATIPLDSTPTNQQPKPDTEVRTAST